VAQGRPKPLTKAELRIMDALWRQRHGTVAEITAALRPPPLAYTTVLTMLRILEQKGVVRRDADARAHVYHPLIERDDAARSAIGEIVQSFFANSKSALAVRLMSEERPSHDELAEIKSLVERYEGPQT
jgi:BlaI family transcriptional regulator, penicillinase repressor